MSKGSTGRGAQSRAVAAGGVLNTTAVRTRGFEYIYTYIYIYTLYTARAYRIASGARRRVLTRDYRNHF